MKIRSGFVSNSSSSSFICDICGNEASGMDISLSDYEMSMCENGHTFCDCHNEQGINLNNIVSHDEKFKLILNHLSGYEKQKEDFEKSMEDGEDIDDWWDDFSAEARDEMPEAHCPLCQFVHVADTDLIKFLLSKTGMTRKDSAKEIRSKVSDYSDFIDKYGKNE